MFIAMIRTVILYFLMVFAVRALGKRQVGELEPSELVFIILISDLAAIPMQDLAIPLVSGFTPIVVLMTLSAVISLITMKSPSARKLFYGKPSIIIENGKLNQKEMKKLRVNMDEIVEELRLQNVADIRNVKYGILETNGQLSVLQFPCYRQVTRRDLKLEAAEASSLPYTLVSNGVVHRENLKKYGITREQIVEILAERNIPSIGEVFFMSTEADGGFFIIRKE